jgi:hypothetical protein
VLAGRFKAGDDLEMDVDSLDGTFSKGGKERGNGTAAAEPL